MRDNLYYCFDAVLVEFATKHGAKYLKKYEDTDTDTPCWVYKKNDLFNAILILFKGIRKYEYEQNGLGLVDK